MELESGKNNTIYKIYAEESSGGNYWKYIQAENKIEAIKKYLDHLKKLSISDSDYSEYTCDIRCTPLCKPSEIL